jgi:hypothetical protein
MKNLFMFDLNCFEFEAEIQDHAYLQEQQLKMIFDFNHHNTYISYS